MAIDRPEAPDGAAALTEPGAGDPAWDSWMPAAVAEGTAAGVPPAPGPTGRAPFASAPSTAHRVRRILIVAALLCLIPPAISYVSAMSTPSNSSFGIRSVEWLRDHGAAGLVSKIESMYYSLEAPRKGGPQLKALPQVGYAPGTAPPALRRAHSLQRTRPAVYQPPRLRPILHPALPGEGIWHPAQRTPGVAPRVLLTTFRTDPNYPRLIIGVAWIDTSRTRITLNPGRLEPSVPLPRGPMSVPFALRHTLLATFNSGFKLADARGGFALNGITYAPMQAGIATLIGYRNGRVDIRSWTGGPRVGADVAFARQNLPLLIDHGHPNPNLGDGPEWGATLGGAIRVWRSAVGVDRRGNLVYVAGDNETTESLASALVHAGAVRGMELDINDYWTSFITYRHEASLDPVNLLPDMVRSPDRYLTPDDRDFFAVYAR